MLLHLYILIKNWSHLFVQFIDVFPIFNKIYYFIAKYIVGIIIIIPLILLFWDIVLWKDNHFVLNWDYSFFQNPLLIEEYNCFTQYLNPSIVYGVNFEYMYSYFAMMFLFVLFFIYSFEFLLLSVLPFIAKDYISLLLWFLCFFGAFRFLIFIFNDGNLGLHFYQLTNEIHRNIDWLWVFENLLNKEWAEPEYQLFVAKVTFVAWRLHFSLLIFGLFMLLNRTGLWKKLQNRYTIFNNWSSKMVVQLESKPKSLIFGMVVGSIIFPYILGYIYSIILNIIVSISNICLKLLATILLGIVGLFYYGSVFYYVYIGVRFMGWFSESNRE